MKTLATAILAITLAMSVLAQSIRPETIENDAIGWIKIYDFKGATASMTVDHRVYSPAQLSIGQLFANWIQASYLPTGALGDVIRDVSTKLGPYNQDTASLPQSYGAYAKIYTDLKYGANRKIEPASNSHILWSIRANGFFGTPTDALNTPQQFYFTLPPFPDGGADLEKAVDLSRHPFLKNFPAYFRRNSATGNQKVVLLSKNRQLPYVHVTKGEYLDAVDAAIARAYESAKAKNLQDFRGNEKALNDSLQYLNGVHDRRTAALTLNRKRYSGRLQEAAEISTDQPDAMLENSPDVFEGTGGSRLRLPVYKIDPVMAELCKTDAPQWIVIFWTAQLNDPVIKHLHDSVVNNFNFEYVYNYFFDPEKVKGQPYKPLRSPAFREPVVATPASEAARRNAADPGVHFFEDFSTTAAGKKPANWTSNLDSSGASSVVVRPNGLEGNWISMNGFRVAPTQLKTPLPQDFTFSYELVAAQNYTWGARGLTVRLSRNAAADAPESFIALRLRPGFDGRDGDAGLETRFAPGYVSGAQSFTASGFSNNARVNRVAVIIRKKGETLQVFINGVKVADTDKAIPAALQFNAISFDLSGTAGPNDQMFLGNIKITRD